MINFVAIPLSRDTTITVPYITQSVMQNIQISVFTATMYFVLKLVYKSYVKSESQRQDNEKIINHLREGLLIVTDQEENRNVLFSNESFKRIIQKTPNDSIEDLLDARVLQLQENKPETHQYRQQFANLLSDEHGYEN